MRVWFFVVIFIWVAQAAFFVPRIGAFEYETSIAQPAADGSILFRFLGETRSIISSLSILQADLYFHGGVGHFFEEHEHGFGVAETPKGAEVYKEPEIEPRPYISPYNVQPYLSEEISVTEHVHLEGDQLKEIVPWLYYAAKTDPHNVLAYTLTGYYLTFKLDKTDEAIEFLREGIKNNPDSWQVYAEMGVIYFQKLEDYAKAVRYLETAKKLLDKSPHDKFQERYVLTFLAESYEDLGQKDKALPLYKRLHELFPDAEAFQKKVGERS